MPKTLRVVLNVSNLEEIVAFYREPLGLPVVGGWDRGPDDRGALLEVSSGGVVEIVGHGPGFATPRYDDVVVAIELEDRACVDATHRRLVEAGAVVTAPVEQSWGHYSLSLRDPVNVEVVLYTESVHT